MSRSSQFQPGKPIRGGVPICFPWFGPRAGDPQSPPHGFARLMTWQIDSIIADEAKGVEITLSLASNETTRSRWPADFLARHIVTVGKSLEMRLEIENRSKAPIQFEEALHTYLTVGDIKQVNVEGLAGKQYIDKVDGAKQKPQSDPLIRFTGETDRVYLDTIDACIVHDPVLNRRIEISKSGSNATVVWNPWINKAKAMADFEDEEWMSMVCVETANVAKHAITLEPGTSHTMLARVQAWPNT
jgi:glucose-6-phosphate 1-epimerase